MDKVYQIKPGKLIDKKIGHMTKGNLSGIMEPNSFKQTDEWTHTIEFDKFFKVACGIFNFTTTLDKLASDLRRKFNDAYYITMRPASVYLEKENDTLYLIWYYVSGNISDNPTNPCNKYYAEKYTVPITVSEVSYNPVDADDFMERLENATGFVANGKSYTIESL